jgi:hypothetical protein
MTDSRTDGQVLEWLRAEYAYPFAGWDFSHLRGRCVEDRERLGDYEEECVRRIRGSRSVVDIGTGDGVRFASYLRQAGMPPSAAATEDYAPNVTLARANLEPLGVRVLDGSGTRPVPSESVDLVVNRHAEFDAADTFRVLQPEGTLVMEQVGDQTNLEIHHALEAPRDTPQGYDTLRRLAGQLDAAGFQVERTDEALTTSRYHDVGILVWYLKAIPWEIPDFSVDAYAEKLVRLHRRIQREGPLDVRFHTVLIVARRPR